MFKLGKYKKEKRRVTSHNALQLRHYRPWCEIHQHVISRSRTKLPAVTQRWTFWPVLDADVLAACSADACWCSIMNPPAGVAISSWRFCFTAPDVDVSCPHCCLIHSFFSDWLKFDQSRLKNIFYLRLFCIFYGFFVMTNGKQLWLVPSRSSTGAGAVGIVVRRSGASCPAAPSSTNRILCFIWWGKCCSRAADAAWKASSAAAGRFSTVFPARRLQRATADLQDGWRMIFHMQMKYEQQFAVQRPKCPQTHNRCAATDLLSAEKTRSI